MCVKKREEEDRNDYIVCGIGVGVSDSVGAVCVLLTASDYGGCDYLLYMADRKSCSKNVLLKED